MKALRTIAVLFLLGAATARADLVVEQAWVRGLPPGVANTAAFMTLRNTGAQDLVVTGVESPLAERVQMHATINHDGMLHMAELATLTIPAGGEQRLESGGAHLMLMGLHGSVAPGTEVELVLLLEGGTRQALQLPVRSVLDE